MLADLVLSLHLLVIGFNLFGLVAVPLGAWLGWNFVHAPVWRLLHLASLGVTAFQALVGQACFLTLWQAHLDESRTVPEPLVARWVNSALYWDFPLYVFALIYALIFIYALALVWLVPLRRK